MERPIIRIETAPEDALYCELYEPGDHPFKETSWPRWQMKNYMNETVDGKTRIEAMLNVLCENPSSKSKIKISIHNVVVGQFVVVPDLFGPMIWEFGNLLGSKSEFFTIKMKIKYTGKVNYLVVSLQIKKEIIDNPSRLSNLFDQLNKVTEKV